ncbi:hypothetical protein B7486_07685 [cyanobacterium TDX16]|nr:hypothetical protein B7486_07685 [cyanobacterium TDX16]
MMEAEDSFRVWARWANREESKLALNQLNIIEPGNPPVRHASEKSRGEQEVASRFQTLSHLGTIEFGSSPGA